MQVYRPVTLALTVVSLTIAIATVASAGQSTAPQTPPKPATPAQKPEPPKPAPTKDEAQTPQTYTETIVVSASKTEQELVNAPATITVIGPRELAVAPSSSYADLLRAVPGVNVSQMSARDINLTSREATSSLSTSQLAVLDGRSIYQDFFGFIMWDFMPVNVNEIKQIEVIRGPASAVWGANALNGVVSVITKSPREMAGTSVTMGAGTFSNDVKNDGAKPGSLFYINGTHADAINDRWSYKISAGTFTQDALPRPTGQIPGGTTTYPPYTNAGTKQPKLDVRVDYDFPDKTRSLSFSGGVSGTSGIMQSGIGPFTIDQGARMSYGKMNYTRKAFKFQVFMNALHGDAHNLLSVDQTGTPIPFSFDTRTIDAEVGNSTAMGSKQVLTYGGNVRFNHFDLTIAPGQTHRTEGGGYVQDEIFITDKARLVAGARVDKFSSISSAVFSPRVALVLKPAPDQTVRVSYNRAFRSPSMINNNLNVTIANPLPLASINPALGSAVFLVPTTATGNPNLTQEHLDAFEVSYTGVMQKRTTVSAAWYYNRLANEILFTQTGEWPLTTPPPGWPLPAAYWGAVQSSVHFPSSFSYENLGTEKNQGVELGVSSLVNRKVNVYVNYSFQAKPVPDFPGLNATEALAEVNLPPKNRFNAGFGYTDARYLASMSVSYCGSAFWQDVLDARFHGTTAAYTMINASAGIKFDQGKYAFTFRVTNLANQDIMQHVFGDVLKRQMMIELHVQLPK